VRAGENAAYYSKIYAWRDPEDDEALKGSWRFIHHFVSEDGDPGDASTVACVTGCGVLNGAMGGTTIPDADREGVHAHLARHLRDAGQDVPELKEITMRETKILRFDLKAVQEDGTFEGRLSVYNVVDQGKDLVEPGAFTKTIQDHDGVVPMLWQHKYDSPIGSLQLEDREDALWVKGTLLLDDAVPDARKAYVLLKAKIVRGLSIGYDVITKELKGGVRRLKELKLYEGSVVTFPMNELATVTGVKSDFNTEFENWQTWDARQIASSALCAALESILWDEEMDAATKVTKSDESITQFHEKYLEILPQLLSLLGMKEQILAEVKAGRTISAATRGKIEAAIKVLQALLESADGTSEEAATTAKEAAAVPDKPEADAHHLLVKSLADMQSAFRAAAQ